MDGFDIDQIDEVIHGRVRLGVMAYLSTAGQADFGEVRNRLQTTDGNLSVHLRKLEEAGYVAVEKTYAGRKPLTRISITEKGRVAYDQWLQTISKLLNATGAA